MTVLIVASILPDVAQAAVFTSQTHQGQSFTSGAGPFSWSFVSSQEENAQYGGVGYQLSTDQVVHRCVRAENLVGHGMVSLSNVSPGTYSIRIFDDYSRNWLNAHGLLESEACESSLKPGNERTDSFTVLPPEAPEAPPPNGRISELPTATQPPSGAPVLTLTGQEKPPPFEEKAPIAKMGGATMTWTAQPGQEFFAIKEVLEPIPGKYTKRYYHVKGFSWTAMPVPGETVGYTVRVGGEPYTAHPWATPEMFITWPPPVEKEPPPPARRVTSSAPAPVPPAPVPLAPVIGPAPPESVVAALTRAGASSAAQSLIRARTHRRAYHMRGHCQLTGAQTARCLEKWYSAQHVSGKTTVSAGVFSIDATHEPVTISFIGVRAQVGCVVRFGTKRCSVKVRWHR